MPLNKLPYKTLTPLIKKNLNHTEDEETLDLIKTIKAAKIRGYLVKSELIQICKWKSPRAIHLILSNSNYKINSITKAAFATKSEKIKIDLLTELKGVSIPMASSILMLVNPNRYGVIDIRVWELLYSIGTMKTNSKGVNFNFTEWYRYLVIIRHFAKKHKTSARHIERTLFKVHKKYQIGNLYSA